MDPGSISPLQRSLDRNVDEDSTFSAEQYKLNFVEIQIPEGHNNPLHYTFNYRGNLNVFKIYAKIQFLRK